MSTLSADDVARYLQANPSFFNDYADLLAQIFVSNPHDGRAVSLPERQMQTLRQKNRQLEEKMSQLLAFGEQNDRISEKLHRLCVALNTAQTPQALLHLVHFHLCDDFGVPYVTVRLWEKPQGLASLPDFVEISEELQVFADTLTRPYCGTTAGFGTVAWFGEHAPLLRSQALVALRDGAATIGMIALGSEDGRRYYADMETLYLERLGEMVSAALVRACEQTAA